MSKSSFLITFLFMYKLTSENYTCNELQKMSMSFYPQYLKIKKIGQYQQPQCVPEHISLCIPLRGYHRVCPCVYLLGCTSDPPCNHLSISTSIFIHKDNHENNIMTSNTIVLSFLKVIYSKNSMHYSFYFKGMFMRFIQVILYSCTALH